MFGQKRATLPFRPAAMLTVALVALACSGTSGTDESGRVVGSVPGDDGGGGQTTVDSATAGGAGTGNPTDCPIEEVCALDVPWERITLEMTPSSISLDGDHAWLAAPDDGALLDVDLAAGSVARTLSVAPGVSDAVPGLGSLWVIQSEFGAGPLLRVDPGDGSTLASIDLSFGGGSSVALMGDSVWVGVNGQSKVARVDQASNAITDSIVLNDCECAGAVGDVVVGGDWVWVIDHTVGSVVRVDPQTRSVESTIMDLGYLEEPSGDFTSILADGPTALAVTAEGVWVLSDVANPQGDANVVGGGALFLLDDTNGSVMRTIELILEPAPGHPGLAMTEGAAWYFDFINGHPVRVDLETGRQTTIRLDNAFAVGVVSDGTTVWYAAESLFDSSVVVGIDAEAAGRASRDLG